MNLVVSAGQCFLLLSGVHLHHFTILTVYYLVQADTCTSLSCVQRVKYLIKPRLHRHQVRSTENLSDIILEEDSFFRDLDEKVEAGSGVGDSLLSVPPLEYRQIFPEKSPAAADVLLSKNHLQMEMENKNME